ncbi:MAG: zinc ABC transporter substrate-binding protein [Anaerolineales bacterium]
MRKTTLLITLLLISICLNACSPATVATPQPQGLKVLAAESFLADIAQNVAGERLTVEALVPPGVDPHEFEPAPQDIAKIAQSRMLIVNGLGYETWLQKTLENGGGPGQAALVVVASKGLTPIVDPSGEHAEGDPHMWMNPINVIRYVENIRDGLTQIDPAGKATYARNAEAYTYRLRDLDQMARRQTSYIPVEKRLLVTNHDSLGYFAQAYDFKIAGTIIPGVTDAASPSAQELAALIKAIKSSGAPAVFLGVGDNQTLAQQIAAETGVKIVSDIYVEGLSAPGGPAATYMDMIQYDVTQIIAALQ